MTTDRTEKLIVLVIIVVVGLAGATMLAIASWDEGAQAGCRKTGGRVEPTTCAPVLICKGFV